MELGESGQKAVPTMKMTAGTHASPSEMRQPWSSSPTPARSNAHSGDQVSKCFFLDGINQAHNQLGSISRLLYTADSGRMNA